MTNNNTYLIIEITDTSTATNNLRKDSMAPYTVRLQHHCLADDLGRAWAHIWCGDDECPTPRFQTEAVRNIADNARQGDTIDHAAFDSALREVWRHVITGEQMGIGNVLESRGLMGAFGAAPAVP